MSHIVLRYYIEYRHTIWSHIVFIINISYSIYHKQGFPGGAVVKNLPANSGYTKDDAGSITALGGSPGEGNGNPLQYSCWENPMDGVFIFWYSLQKELVRDCLQYFFAEKVMPIVRKTSITWSGGKILIDSPWTSFVLGMERELEWISLKRGWEGQQNFISHILIVNSNHNKTLVFHSLNCHPNILKHPHWFSPFVLLSSY